MQLTIPLFALTITSETITTTRKSLDTNTNAPTHMSNEGNNNGNKIKLIQKLYNMRVEKACWQLS